MIKLIDKNNKKVNYAFNFKKTEYAIIETNVNILIL